MTWSLEDLLPHRVPMVFIDRVESFDASARSLTAAFTVTPKHILYSPSSGGVPNWAAIEFMAQAAAALAGIFDKTQDSERPARPGLLLGTRKLDLLLDSFKAGRTYRVTASSAFWDAEAAAFTCTISDDSGAVAAEATLNAYRPPDFRQFLKEAGIDMKRVLVTGSSRGIGKAIAERLRADGFHVVTHAVRSAADLQFDVADREATRSVLEADVAANGPFYGVVLNAGVADDAPFPALEGEAWDRVLRTDLDGFYNVLKPLVMPMVSNRIRGRIVAISSVSGIAGNRGQVNYSAAKAGVIGAVKALAVELAKRGITVNAVAPGVIETEMAAAIEFPDEVRKAIPMRRFGTPEEVAAVVSFLFREDAAYVTRQVISVNGGLF